MPEGPGSKRGDYVVDTSSNCNVFLAVKEVIMCWVELVIAMFKEASAKTT